MLEDRSLAELFPTPVLPDCRTLLSHATKNPEGSLGILHWKNCGSGEILRHELPVHQAVEESLDELGAQVAVVDVVGMLPHVHTQQRLVAGGQRRAGRPHIDRKS